MLIDKDGESVSDSLEIGSAVENQCDNCAKVIGEK